MTEVAKILYSQHDPAKDKPMEAEISWTNLNPHPHPNPDPDPDPGPNPNPNPHQVEISWICDATDKMHMIVPAAVKEEAETAAKAYREAMDDD